MRRFVSWLSIFIICTSLLPPRVSALEEPSDSPNKEVTAASTTETSAHESVSPPVQSLPDVPASELTVATPPTETTAPVVNSVIDHTVATPETTPDGIITTFNVSSTIEYIELYNQSTQPIDMSQVRFRATAGNNAPCELGMADTGWVLPDEYITLRSPTTPQGTISHVFTGDCLFASDISRIELYYRGSRIQLIDGITTNTGSWMRHAANVKTNTKTTLDCTHKNPATVMKQTGTIGDYVRCRSGAELYNGTLYLPPSHSELKIVEILPNARNCMPSDTALDCSDYIKIKNTSSDVINLADFRVRSGTKYSSATLSSSFNWHQPTLNPARDELMLPAGQYFLLRLRNDGQVLGLSGSDGNVWIEDYYGVRTYDEASYAGMDLAAASGKSWAYDMKDHTWKFGVPSPYGDNSYPSYEPGRGSTEVSSGLVPCREGQYRSEETNRCRTVTTTAGLTPCKEGQYRSEETNRCRSIALAAAAVLKPCADDQFRNPTSGRCKKIASSDDATSADCGEGRERNPETHRCRNVLSKTIPAAAFAVEPIKEAGKAFVGWWALGGVGVAALGYGAWEWRREMLAGIRKVSTLFTSGK